MQLDQYLDPNTLVSHYLREMREPFAKDLVNNIIDVSALDMAREGSSLLTRCVCRNVLNVNEM
jgi:hypothetical protein